MSMNLKINRYDTKKEKRRKVSDIIYVVITMMLFAFLGVSMFIFPRSTESELEKRELEKFPRFSLEAFVSGEFTQSLNTYFSDTVPYRDDLMVISSMIRNMTGFRINNIKFYNVTVAENVKTESAETLPPQTEGYAEESFTHAVEGNSPSAQTSVPENDMQQEPFSEITTAENAEAIDMDDTVNITNNGIVVVGTRALMFYGGSYTVGENYAKVVSEYKKQLGSGVNVYCMVIPTSVEFYCPKEAKQFTSEQLGNINNIYLNLTNGVKPVDAYTPLSLHKDEPIYFRTDHHWSSLGAYYAAKQFAETADVPFSDLSEYDEKVVDGYVGTMYSYAEYNPVLKNNPEDFVYYVPKNVEYTTTYHNYILGENNVIVGMQEPYDANFFVDFSNNKSMLYCTFMGGDAKITHVKTSTKNGRKLAIFKDSYGNALPQFLFGSFEEIFVMDMRFFTYNAIDYFKENGITDLLFANNAFHATTKSTVTHYETFLIQGRQTAPQETTATTPATVPAVMGISPQVTAPPVTSNAPSVTTTVPPVTTSVPATTSPPVTTTTVPATTSVTSVTTTTAEPAVTEPSKTTTKSGSETTAKPKTTTKSKTETTAKPEATTKKPAKPEATTKKPAETSVPTSAASASEEIIDIAD